MNDNYLLKKLLLRKTDILKTALLSLTNLTPGQFLGASTHAGIIEF